MKEINNCDKFVLTRAQYDNLPSPLHKLTVDILVGRGECILKEKRIVAENPIKPAEDIS